MAADAVCSCTGTTLIDYTFKVRRHIIKELGEKRMAEVTLDDIQVALVPVYKKSASVYKSVVTAFLFAVSAGLEICNRSLHEAA